MNIMKLTTLAAGFFSFATFPAWSFEPAPPLSFQALSSIKSDQPRPLTDDQLDAVRGGFLIVVNGGAPIASPPGPTPGGLENHAATAAPPIVLTWIYIMDQPAMITPPSHLSAITRVSEVSGVP